MIDPGRALTAYRSKGILVDANLLLLLILGDIDPSYIRQFKRTSSYELTDYELLDRVLKSFGGRIATTPNVLTEVSNLANALKNEWRDHFFERFAEVIPGFAETYLKSAETSCLPRFGQFGLTDLGILQLAKDRYLVLTADGRLADYLARQGVDVLTFETLRALDQRR